MRFFRSLALTVFIPCLLFFIGDNAPLPGIDSDLVTRAGTSRAAFGVLALGIQPILSAYWLVEVVAFLVPRWSTLRHGNPEGRAKLDRAVGLLAFALATMQAFGMSQSLLSAGLSASPRWETSLLVELTLLGGLAIQFLAARLISRHGLMNGFVALFGAALIRQLVDALTKSPVGAPNGFVWSASTHREIALNLAAIAIAVGATWAALTDAGRVPHSNLAEKKSSTPYRDARRLVVHPWIPIPSSSFQVYVLAVSLLMLPATLVTFDLPFRSAVIFLQGDAFTPALVATTGVLMIVFARLLHRPAEMADLAASLGATNAKKIRTDARDALARTLLPSFLFLLTIIFSETSWRIGGLTIAVLTVILLDFAHSSRLASRVSDLAIVWEERRASAVPALRAALAADGIATHTRGMAVLSFWQVFAPYAPAQILVAREDHARAATTLSRFRGIKIDDPIDPSAAPAQVPVIRWSLARRTGILAACAAGAGIVALCMHFAPEPIAGPTTRAKLEIVRVDDTIDAFEHVSDDSIPADQGISIYTERVPVGPDQTAASHYARIVFSDGETKPAAIGRARAWLATIALPSGARFGLEDIVDDDEDAKTAKIIGLRTYVLVGDAALHTDDVVDAAAIGTTTDDEPDVSVAVTLSPKGARALADLTQDWTMRRIAILIDDEINTAPVVKTTITGGRLTLSLGRGDIEKKTAEAKALARALRGN